MTLKTNLLRWLCLFLTSCTIARVPTDPDSGLTGMIFLVRGNQMPSPGRPLNTGQPVSRELVVCEPITAAKTTGLAPLYTAINARLITGVNKSSSNGSYNIKLPPGRYSVFIKEGDKYFAEETDGTGVLNPVIVNKGSITKKNFTININAAY